uniref:(northern house mosquito) hypothetical protein n=1 Tax=Culex pipiens TaxID=7175 RepID=A0A8D8H303_CULPI
MLSGLSVGASPGRSQCQTRPVRVESVRRTEATALPYKSPAEKVQNRPHRRRNRQPGLRVRVGHSDGSEERVSRPDRNSDRPSTERPAKHRPDRCNAGRGNLRAGNAPGVGRKRGKCISLDAAGTAEHGLRPAVERVC